MEEDGRLDSNGNRGTPGHQGLLPLAAPATIRGCFGKAWKQHVQVSVPPNHGRAVELLGGKSLHADCGPSTGNKKGRDTKGCTTP